MDRSLLSRRQLLSLGCGVGAQALLGSGCSATGLRTEPNTSFLKVPEAPRPGRVLLGCYSSPSLKGLCERLPTEVSDFRWLSRGDSVFLKVASNSPHRHPAVTDPEAVSEVVRFLKQRGAGRVWVGDQAGVEHVRLTAQGRVSSTRELFARNGLRDALVGAGAKVHCFDDQSWDGYFLAEADFNGVWNTGVWLPNILKHVDHVVYLPRLGTHALAGYTCGIKNAVGWLRDDSRLILHQKGASFFERIAEINHFPVLRSKLRLTITLCHAALTNIGPDFGAVHRFDGCVAIASTNLVDHDAVASAILPWIDQQHSSFYDLYSPYPTHVNYWNRGLVKETWGESELQGYEEILAYPLARGLEHDACLSHLGRLQGYRPTKIEVLLQGDRIPPTLLPHLRSVGSGLFVL